MTPICLVVWMHVLVCEKFNSRLVFFYKRGLFFLQNQLKIEFNYKQVSTEITSFRDPWPNNLKVNLSKTADCFILLAKELHPSESPDLVNIENGNVMKMVKNLCIRRQGLCSWMTLPAQPRVVQPCQGVTHINIILNNNTRMQIRSQPCQCPVCSVHPIFGSLHMGALLGRPWLRCSLCQLAAKKVEERLLLKEVKAGVSKSRYFSRNLLIIKLIFQLIL